MAEPPNSGADLLDPYPQSCPFCAISAAYPHRNLSQTHHHSSSSKPLSQSLYQYVPSMPDASLVEPNCHLILNTPQVLAFLDIMPLSPGHVLVITRNHHVKLGDVPGDEARELGFWLPLVSKAVVKAVGADDWNVVQNNGPRAAQVVPHVHFHIIPRPETLQSLESRSWTMFGRGRREDLDDEEAARRAKEIRDALKQEIDRTRKEKSSI